MTFPWRRMPTLRRKLQSLLQSPTKGVHEATGHRPPQRLARALLLSGAPPEAVQAARELKCDVCAERRAPKTGELEVCPLLGLWASRLTWTSWLSRMPLAVPMSLAMPATTDAVSKFQQASILPDKSAASVVDFMATTWLPLLGAPRTIIADQGREFIAAEFQDWCSAHSVLLWHAAVQAPWQNGTTAWSRGSCSRTRPTGFARPRTPWKLMRRPSWLCQGFGAGRT